MKQSLLEEKWTRWEPIKGLSPKYFIDSILVKTSPIFAFSESSALFASNLENCWAC